MPPNMPTGAQKRRKNLFMPLFFMAIVLLGASLIFGFWAFGKMQDYKNNVDQKIAAASQIISQQVSTTKDKEFAEKEKSPLKHYSGPGTYGSLDLQYPKTWSAYIDQTNSNVPLNGYFHPDYVPGVQSGTAYALHIQVLNQTYDAVLKQLDSKVKSGKVTVSAFRATKVPSLLGSRASGEINLGQKDTQILLPLRDKTIVVGTESDQFLNDLNNIILPSLSFSP